MGTHYKHRRINHASRTKRGLGKGTGRTYRPYVGVRDVFSKGKSAIIPGWTTGRQHELLSSLELAYFLFLDWLDAVIDIREQFPLPLKLSLRAAKTLGVKHPFDNRAGEYKRLTTDLVYTLSRNGCRYQVPRAMKYQSDISDRRTWEKLELERLTWLMMPGSCVTPWKVVTEEGIPITFVENVELVHRYRDFKTLHVPSALMARLAASLTAAVMRSTKPLGSICRSNDEAQDVDPGMNLLVAKHLIARKLWTVDMNKPIGPTHTLSLLGASRSLEKTIRA